MQRKGRVTLISLGLLAALAAGDLAWGPHARLGPGRRLRDSELLTPEGAPARLSAFAGKPILIQFFATW